jgi:peptide-methionine (R)-S-oxide reductase
MSQDTRDLPDPTRNDEFRDKLTDAQYRVTREGGTEPAFSGAYYDEKTEGTYRCVCCGARLFESTEKYESGSGWPSFFRPAADANIRELTDDSHGMRRVEVRCGSCDAHLGHVFPDGPAPTGQRYCINSLSLDLEKAKP